MTVRVVPIHKGLYLGSGVFLAHGLGLLAADACTLLVGHFGHTFKILDVEQPPYKPVVTPFITVHVVSPVGRHRSYWAQRNFTVNFSNLF